MNKGDFHAEGDSNPLLIPGVSANLTKTAFQNHDYYANTTHINLDK